MIKHKLQIILVAAVCLIILSCGLFPTGTGASPQPTPEDTAAVEPLPTQAPTESPQQYVQYWTEVVDPRTGIHFTMPCFWQANIPSGGHDPSGLGSFSVQNFTQDWVESFGPKRNAMIWDYGAVKIDIGYFTSQDYNLPADATALDLVNAMYPPDQPVDSDNKLVATEQVTINGQPAQRVDSEGTFGPSAFYLIPVQPGLFLLFGSAYFDHPDIQGILNSVSVSPEREVHYPDFIPSAPPDGMSAACLADIYQTSPAPSFANTIPCGSGLETTPEMVACNIMDGLRSRNLSALSGYMRYPFIIGYWRSEGVELTAEEAIAELSQNRLPAVASDLTFTGNRSEFPQLDGVPPETMFGPGINFPLILYSEGWGADGQGAALIYLALDQDGNVFWYGLVVAQDHFN